jgi:hypothetical protein
VEEEETRLDTVKRKVAAVNRVMRMTESYGEW